MSDIRCQFYITFQSLMLKDCPDNLKNKKCQLRFKRNANDLSTKQSVVDAGGFCEFNEKIEMKTFITWEESQKRFAPKMAQLQACMEGGLVLGSTDINLSDYATPNKYLQNLTLKDTTNGIGSNSFIIVEISTHDAAKPEQERRTAPSAPTGRPNVYEQ